MRGANTAMKMKSAVSTRPAMSMPRWSPTLCRSWCTTGMRSRRSRFGGRTAMSVVMSVPHPRVDERRDDVDDEVGERDDHGEQCDDALHGDEVAGLEVLGEHESEALPLEGRLGEHRAAEEQR